MATQNDEPISRKDEDVLGRFRLASAITNEIERMDLSRGAVIGILGPWGSGKTSLLNLTCNALREADRFKIVEFNPWLFSGANQLIDSFFSEISAQLKIGPNKLESIADELASYGEVIAPLQVLPVVGAWIERASGGAEALKQLAEKRAKSVVEQREHISSILSRQTDKIVVVVDDVDRLATAEIRDIFKLIRLTANFPNVLYLIAFDRARVEAALGEDNLPGRDYLEKIIQVTYDIPAIPFTVLSQQVTDSINRALDGVENVGPFDETRWPDVFLEVILPLVRTMRHVRRYAAVLPGTVRSLDGNVSLVDVLALEAIRVFLPDVFAELHQVRDALTTSETGLSLRHTFGAKEAENRHRASIAALLAISGRHSEVIEGMIERLFPAGAGHLPASGVASWGDSRWLPNRRVAHRDVFDFYLERVVGSGLQAFSHAERAKDLLADDDQLEAYFRSLDPATWEDIISTLEHYQDTFLPEAAAPATAVLLNLLPELPDRPRGFFSFSSRIVVTRVVLRLLRRLRTPAEIEDAVRETLPKIATLWGKWELLTLVGYRENAGHKLVSEEASREFEADLRKQIREASRESLVREPDLPWLLYWAKKESLVAGENFSFVPDQALAEVLLKDAVTGVRSQGTTTRYIRVEKRLAWDTLADLVGGEDEIRKIVEASAKQDDPDLSEAITLARKYLNGWRPNDFGSSSDDGQDS